MCYPATCQRCGKTTWDGCGMHVDDVMSTVSKDQQCDCDSNPSAAAGGQSLHATAAERPGQVAAGTSIWR